jgi:PAS domain-containing protein
VRLLANPMFMRMAFALLVMVGAFAIGILGLRALRRRLVGEDSLPESLGSAADASFAYSAVIQNLKQQKFELQNEHAIQKRRAKTSEHITAAVIANLPCGVLFIGPNGLVKQANAAARQLLGFASPLGMSPDELFRETTAVHESGEPARLADAIRNSLRDRQRDKLEAAYEDANGEQKHLSITLIPLTVPPDDASGLACVIANETAVAQLRRDEMLRSELSVEMALDLRASLSIIRDCAAKIGAADNHSATGLANDIAAQADRLDKVVGSFLAGYSTTKAMAARA